MISTILRLPNKESIRLGLPLVPRVGEYITVPGIPDPSDPDPERCYLVASVKHVLTWSDEDMDEVVHHFTEIVLR